MTNVVCTQAHIEALGAKLDACDFTEKERAVLGAVFFQAAHSDESEVSGFGFDGRPPP
jgi:hypothetical protein